MNVPRLLRWQDDILTVAAKWKAQYCHAGQWHDLIMGSSKEIYQRLRALPSSATPADVDRAIGTDGWASFWCNGCHEYVDTAIQLGDEPDYESATVTLCFKCFDRAVELRQSVGAVVPVAGVSAE